MSQYTGTPKTATTIPLADANTPFNPSAVSAADAANRDSILAIEQYGFFKTTYNSVKPPYPAAGLHVNNGTYQLGTVGSTKVEFSSAKTYYRAASPIAWFKTATWFPSFNAAPPKAQYRQLALASASDDALVFSVELPNLCTLKKARIKINPANTHVAVPAGLPTLYVYLGSNESSATTLIASASGYNGTGSYADVAQYQAEHEIIVDLASTAFDAGYNSLLLKFVGEFDVDSQVDLLANVPRIDYERTRFGEEFGALAP